jgi:hypothetical protein
MRTKLQVVDGGSGKNVEYILTYEDGSTQKCMCSIFEWRAWEIQQQLISLGVDEKLIEELYYLGYNIGHESPEQDAGNSWWYISQ